MLDILGGLEGQKAANLARVPPRAGFVDDPTKLEQPVSSPPARERNNPCVSATPIRPRTGQLLQSGR